MFKKLNVLLGLLLLSTPAFAGLPPTTAAGQNGSKLTTFNFQVPNNQATDVGGATLLETGSQNILTNPSFEHKTTTSVVGWFVTNGTQTQESSIVVHGKKSLKIAATSGGGAVALTGDSNAYAAQFAAGTVQGLAMVRAKSDIALSVCSRINQVTSTTNCVSVPASNTWGLYKVPFILGAGYNGISIASATAQTGTIYIDDAFVGAVDLKADVPQVEMQTHNRGTGAFTANNTITGGTVTTSGVNTIFSYNSTTGTYTLLQPAIISFSLTMVSNAGGSAMQPAIYKNGLTNALCVGGSTANLNTTCSGLELGQAGDYYVAYNNGGAVSTTTTIVTAIKSTNMPYYSSSSVGYGWTSYTPTLTGQGTAVTGTLGGMYRKTGDSLEINITYAVTSTGGSGATALEFTIPSGYTVNDTKARMLNGLLGHAATYNIPTLYAETPVATFNNKIRVIKIGTGAHITGADLASNSQIELKITLPVNELQDSNVIVGSFKDVVTTPSAGKPIIFSGQISTAGVVSLNKGGIISTASCSTGTWTVNFGTTLASAPNCHIGTVGANAFHLAPAVTSATTTALTFVTAQDVTQNYNCLDSVNVICHGELP